jgi:hypothetical protein
LYIDPNTGIYQPKAPNQDIRPSIFRRQIKVTEIVGTDQAKVVSSVRWIDRGKSQGVDLVTYISNE